MQGHDFSQILVLNRDSIVRVTGELIGKRKLFRFCGLSHGALAAGVTLGRMGKGNFRIGHLGPFCDTAAWISAG